MKKLLLIFMFLFFFSSISAFNQTLHPRPIINNNLQPNTFFDYQFDYTTDFSCNNILMSQSGRYRTDESGIATVLINQSDPSGIPIYLCEYRDGSLRKVHSFRDAIFKSIYTQNIESLNWSNITGSKINNNLNWINWSVASNGTLMLSSNWNATNTSYYLATNPFSFVNITTASTLNNQILSHWNNLSNIPDIWNSTYYGGIGNWSADKSDYFTSSQILGFSYYNSTDFSISDYFTKSNILGFNYYNSTDFDINDYYLKTNPFSFYNSTTFPDNYLLNTGDTATGNYIFSNNLSVTENLSVDTNTLFVDSNNNRVGIGTTNPNQGTAGGGTAKVLELNDGTNSVFRLVGGDTIGSIQALNGSALWIGTMSDSTSTTLKLTTGGLPRVTIDGTGKVGIGNETPETELEVAGDVKITGSGSVVDAIKLYKSTNADRRWIAWSQGGGVNDWRLGQKTYNDILGLYNSGASVGNASSPGSIVMSWDATTGKVGIGTETPGNKLEVYGGATTQTGASIGTRGSKNSFEWGHANQAGYGSTLGFEKNSGSPFICFKCEHGTNVNTYRTRGQQGFLIKNNNNLVFSYLGSTNADNQADTDAMQISSTGGICSDTDADLSACTSDIRLKQNITYFTNKDLINLYNSSLTPAHWVWNSTFNNSGERSGFIAQDVQSVIPEWVSTNADGYLVVDDSELKYYNFQAIKKVFRYFERENEKLMAAGIQQKQRIDNLQAQINTMQSETCARDPTWSWCV